jgi:hypothetical protein
MTAKVRSRYTWNINDYCVIVYGDGTCIELSSAIGLYTTDKEWIDKALKLYAARPVEPDPMDTLIRCCPDEMLIAEVLRRHLAVAVSGEVV